MSLTMTQPFGLRNVAPDLSGSTGVDCFRTVDSLGTAIFGSLSSFGGGCRVETVRREMPSGSVPDTSRFGTLVPSFSSVALSLACRSCKSLKPFVLVARCGLAGFLAGEGGRESVLVRRRAGDAGVTLCARSRDVDDRASWDFARGESTIRAE